MNWPLKIQGRFLTKLAVDEIRVLLTKYPDWNRSRLSREVCEHWNWRRPDGQLKDMACRELLSKLESRFLIKLPPRQRPGPGRAPIIESVNVDKRPVSCRFDFQTLSRLESLMPEVLLSMKKPSTTF